MAKPPKHTFIDRLKEDTLPTTGFAVAKQTIIDNTILNWEFRQIESIVFNEKVVVQNVNIKCGLAFSNCTFNKGISIKNIDSEQMISQHNPHNCSILFSNCQGTYLEINDNSKLKRGLIIENQSSFEIIKIYRYNGVWQDDKIDGRGVVSMPNGEQVQMDFQKGILV